MISILHKLGVEVNSVEQPIDLRVPEQKMMLSIYLTTPEIENDRRSKNTTMGMRKCIKEGRWVSTAPFGYKNVRDVLNKPVIIFGPKAELAKRALDLFATGC